MSRSFQADHDKNRLTLDETFGYGVTSSVLVFADGALHLNRDGTGSLVFREDELEWEPDDESPVDYRVAKLPASEVIAIRDELNKRFPATVSQLDDHTLEAAAQIVEGCNHWGLSQRMRDAVENFQRFAARVIRVQKSDSPEHVAQASPVDPSKVTF